MAAENWRLPAEWEPQSAILLAWPSAASAWESTQLSAAQQEFYAFIAAIVAHQDVILLNHPTAPALSSELPASPRLHCLAVEYNDTWCRDYGPITLVAAGQRLALDFTFNGWGGKYPATLDNRVNQALAQDSWLQHYRFRQHLFELEGGAIDSDGKGNILLNWHCISLRFPERSRGVLETQLLELLQAERILGIDVPPLPGDDTDGHIDTIARFVDTETIVFQQGEPAWTAALREQLEGLRRSDGQPYKLVALPAVASPHVADDGRVLATSYVNFLFTNEALLVPQYGDAADHRALDILRPLAGEREVIGLSARTIVLGNGSLHCCAMNLPAALS